jgi:hypothetical protein
MATLATQEDLDLLDCYKSSLNVGKLYDDDEEFAAMLRRAIPKFEYPDFSWMTVAQVKAHIVKLK